jgi:divalent metal cation (Fe/Co/Zn/Cd) transporter
MHLGPNQLLVNLAIDFRRGLDGAALAKAIDRIEDRIRRYHPIVRYIFIEVESLRGQLVRHEPAPGEPTLAGSDGRGAKSALAPR